MPHVSRHMPEGKVWEKIYKDLLDQVALEGTAQDRKRLLAELITPTERIMLAKRLAIICMIGEGYTFEDIQEMLRVSPSTIGRIWAAMQRGKYRSIISVVQKRKIAKAISSFFPRPYTAPRWEFLK